MPGTPTKPDSAPTPIQELATAPDSQVVSIGFGDDWSDTHDVVHCSTPDDVRRLLARRGPTWRRRYGAMFQCEVEQYEAAAVIGVQPTSMCFRVRWRRAKPAGQLTRRWFGVEPALLIRHTAPKLAIAAIYAVPTVPTTFDLERLVEFGYADIADVTARILRWNEAGPNEAGERVLLPLPRSSASIG